MKLREAYTILGLSPGASPDEAKKQYRKLTKEFHPDVNKEPDAEAKFKKINEAYQVVQSGEDTEPHRTIDWNQPFGNHPNYADFFNINPFSTKRQYYSSNIELQITISFKESVQGCNKEIQYSRQVKCPYCHGNGNRPINNGCKTCGGQGQTTSRQHGAVFIRTCTDCLGKTSNIPCNECKTSGVVDAQASVHVTIPAFVVDGNILRLSGMGNFSGTFMGVQDQHTDVLLHIKVISEPGLRLEKNEIVSEVEISLLESFLGCNRMIQTIDGSRLIDIPKGTKNKEEVVLSVGDNNNIKHRVIVHVSYPANVDKLIDVLRS
jgi:molecular chaperone DnaJ